MLWYVQNIGLLT